MCFQYRHNTADVICVKSDQTVEGGGGGVVVELK